MREVRRLGRREPDDDMRKAAPLGAAFRPHRSFILSRSDLHFFGGGMTLILGIVADPVPDRSANPTFMKTFT
jgi:hypothetical protein